ncbi:MAG: putative ABC exporter domain-containing protein [Verrucomicrobiota bacterium]
MLGALAYLQFHSFKNRLTSRFKRLKQPKYLVGAVVGGLYFYWYFFRYLFGGFGHAHGGAPAPETLQLLESLGALVLAVVVLMMWIFPAQRAALTFTEAEISMLFPAPVTRQTLVQFKLARAQLRIFITTFVLTLISNRFGGNPWIHAAGWYLIFSTLNLHAMGASFTRTMLLDRGITSRRQRVAILALLAVAAVIVAAWAAKTLPSPETAFHPERLQEAGNNPAELSKDFADMAGDYARRVLTSGPVPWILFPFRILTRVFLAPNGAAFLWALLPALILVAAHYAWVIRSDVAFEEASLEASQKMADRMSAVRSGKAGVKYRPRRSPFRLRPLGPSPVALLWKNLVAAGQMFTLRIAILAAIIVLMPFAVMSTTMHGSNWLPIVGSLSGVFGFWVVIIGPQVARVDLRQDLMHVDVLKMYPMRGWQIVLGELLAPVAILTAIQWVLIGVDVVLFFRSFPAWTLVLSLSAAVVLPILNFISLLIPNAGVLLFPAWMTAGKDGARGIEVTGQRLIMGIGQMLALVIALLPAAIAFTVVFFSVRFAAGAVPAVPAGALFAALILAAEAAAGIYLLGGLFERFDLSAELTA